MSEQRNILSLRPLAVALAVLLGGCAMGPDYVRPEAAKQAVTAQYSEAVQGDDALATPQVDSCWWLLFGDSRLNRLVDSALKNNADLQQAVARVEEADAAMREVGAALVPNLTLTGSSVQNRVSQLTTISPPNPLIRKDHLYSLSMSYELDFWGRVRRLAESAAAQALATHHARDTLRISIAGLVTQQYLALRSLESQVAAVESSLATRLAQQKIMSAQLNAGSVSPLEQAQEDTARALLTAQLADLRQQRAVVAHQLVVLTGEPELKLSEGDVRDLPMPVIPPIGLPSSLLQARPDIRQAEELLVAANAKIGAARAAYFPTISLTGSVGSQSSALSNLFTLGSGVWSGGVGVSMPIFDAGKTAAREDQASAQQKQALAAYRKAIQTAFKEVQDALSGLRETAVADDAAQQRVNAAQRAFELSEKRYQAGYSRYQELLDAQRTLNDALLAQAKARQARLSMSVDLFKALGGGWQEAKAQ